MCTAIFKNSFLARTVDRIGSIDEHFIISRNGYIGGIIRNTYGEIWIDGMNSYGLMAALLNYRKELTNESSYSTDSIKLHPSKLVPFLLENCHNTKEVSRAVSSLQLTYQEPEMYPHYIIADKSGACCIYENGKVFDNPLGVLTNAPSFPEQLSLLKAQEICSDDFYSSKARFRRIAMLQERVKIQSVSDCFDLLTSVTVPQGADKRHKYRTVLRCVMSQSTMTYSYADGCSGNIKSVLAAGDFEIPAGSGIT